MRLLVESILPPKFKLRDDIGDLSNLKQSLQVRQLHDIIVRPKDGKYELIAGFRRWVSAKELKWQEIDAKVIDVDDKEALEIALTENIERKDMDPIEEANAFKLYVHDRGYGSATQLAARIGVSDAYISRSISLLNLDHDTFERLKTNKITPAHGVELVGLAADKAISLADYIENTNLTRDQTRKAVDYVRLGLAVPQAVQAVLSFPDMASPEKGLKYNPIMVAREQIHLALTKCLKSIDMSLEYIPEGSEKGIWIKRVRYPVHELINAAWHAKKEFSKEQ